MQRLGCGAAALLRRSQVGLADPQDGGEGRGWESVRAQVGVQG